MSVLLIFSFIVLFGTINNFSYKIFSLHCADNNRSIVMSTGMWSAMAALFYGACMLFYGLKCSLPDVLFGILAGLGFAFTLYYNLLSYKEANVVTVVLICNASVMLPIFGDMLLFHQMMTLRQFVGIIVLFVSIALIVFSGSFEKPLSSKGVLYISLTFIFNGSVMICQKTFPKLYQEHSIITFSFFTFLFTFVFCMLKTMTLKGQHVEYNKYFILSSGAVGIGLCAVNQLNMMISASLPSVIQFPLQASLVLVCSTIFSSILFHEKVTLLKICGIALCIVGAFSVAM